MKPRTPWEGMLTIARLNWPFYLAAAVVLVAGGCALWMSVDAVTKIAGGFAMAGSLYFIGGSLGVSHLIYDRSDLYRWKWLERALSGRTIAGACFCHAGFDEASRFLQAQFAAVEWLILDHFDPTRMTEPSIRRARRLFPPVPGTMAAAFDRWPVDASSVDVVFGLLAIHELRSEPERTAWFAECRRCLRPEGRVVLVEHLRDLPNCLAFGPGFLHFHARASWSRCWTAAGLRAVQEFPVTPWVRVFVLGAA